MPHNIERHPLRPRTYIGYSLNQVWRITKTESGWQAHTTTAPWRYRSGRLLVDISEAIEAPHPHDAIPA
jgi:hypothetical protein